MWLMKKSLAEAMERARAEGKQPPQVVLAAYERNFMAASSGEPRIFKRAGDVAEIMIEGVLTSRPDYYAYWMGGGNTTYPEIIQSLALAAADPTVKRVVLNVNSPGGYVGGLFDTLAALEAFSKPKETVAAMADSAAYAIAALGGKITATNPAAEFGSVGVCATYVQYDFEKVYEITSSNAPNKRPDPSTEEGQAVIRKYLDAIEELFVDAIAKGRGTTAENVTTNFGRGEVMLAGAAKKLGLIDKITKQASRSPLIVQLPEGAAGAAPVAADDDADDGSGNPAPAAAAAPAPQPKSSSATAAIAAPAPEQSAPAACGGAPEQKEPIMNLKQLQTEHTELYATVLNQGKAEGQTAGFAEGVTAERKRVSDHLKLGTASGDPETAHKAIESGASVSEMTATYLAASMKRGAVDARQQDSDNAGAALGGNPPKPAVKTAEDDVAAELEKLMGPAAPKAGK